MPKPIFSGTTAESLTREGLTDQIQVWEDGQRVSTDRGTFEWWYFDAHLDDGSTTVVVFATKPLLERQGPLKPNLSLTITRPDGTRIARFPLFPPGQFSASKETCDVRIGSNWARGDLHRYEVHAQVDGLGVDLEFTGLVPAWRPGAGKAYFGDRDHFFAWLPSIPFGTVNGTLTYDGETRAVNGTGYHDHNWGNIGLFDVMDHWYWGRAHLGEYTAIFVEQIASAAYGHVRMPVFMLAKGGRILIGDGAPLTMQARDFSPHADGCSFPREVDFSWESAGEWVRLRLREPRLIEAASLLGFLPKWQARLARLFANPYYFRFHAQLELEVNLAAVRAHERGPALYEIMILQGRRHE